LRVDIVERHFDHLTNAIARWSTVSVSAPSLHQIPYLPIDLVHAKRLDVVFLQDLLLALVYVPQTDVDETLSREVTDPVELREDRVWGWSRGVELEEKR
jgi:hypothetical protein